MSWKSGFSKRLLLLFILTLMMFSTARAELGKGLLHGRESKGQEENPSISQRHEMWNIVCWSDPELLLNELENAEQKRELKPWCTQVKGLIGDLSRMFPLTEVPVKRILRFRNAKRNYNGQNSGGEQIPLSIWNFENTEIVRSRKETLQQLTQKVYEARELQKALTDVETRTLLLRVNYTLQRRIILWSYCDQLLLTAVPQTGSTVSEAEWRNVLSSVEEIVQAHPYRDTWNNYLRLETLKQFFTADFSPLERREVAWQILGRLNPGRIDPSQAQFLSQAPFGELKKSLERFASVRTAEDCLMQSVEDYEMAENLEAGNRLVLEVRRFEMEQGTAASPSQKALEAVYRNANLRLYVSHDFLNSSIPQPGSEERMIQENMLNREIYGRGVTNTTVRVKMIPDENQFHLGFLVEGTMESSTYSPDVVTVYNQSAARYTAFKEVLFSSEGFESVPAVVKVQNQIQLRDLRTPLDPIPLVGFVAHGVARSQAEAKQENVRQISKQRIGNEVTTSLDSQVDQKLNSVNQFLNEKIYTALSRFELNLDQIDASTTEEAAVIRLRLAGNIQPGANTPRPVPPADSKINFQVHESTINNFLQQFHFEGKTFTMEELVLHLRKRLPNTKIGENFQKPVEEVFLTFADENAVSVKFENGQFLIRVAVKHLSVGKRSWKDFVVEAPYDVETGPMAVLVNREGPIHLIGRIPVGQQVAVRGIFSKIFQKTEPKNILPEKFIQNPRFAELQLDQFVIQDGWLGVSFGALNSTQYTAKR